MIKKNNKVELIEVLTSVLCSNEHIYFADTSHMNAGQMSEFRRSCYDSQVKIQVVKNTLLRKAMEKDNVKWSSFFHLLKGNTSIISSKINNIPAKIIQNFRKKNNINRPILKGAYIEEYFYIGNHHIDRLVKMKSKEQLIVDIIGLLTCPVTSILVSLHSSGGKILCLLEALLEK